MIGFSTTLLYVKNSDVLNLLDAHTSAPAWPKSCGIDVELFEYTSALSNKNTNTEKKTDNEKFIQLEDENFFKFVLKTICEDLIAFKDHLNEVKKRFFF